jgi:hypothetical protein
VGGCREGERERERLGGRGRPRTEGFKSRKKGREEGGEVEEYEDEKGSR